MFTAYFDASGTITSSEYVILAGFIATADQWIAWEAEWLARLKQDGLSYLHMRELAMMDTAKRTRLVGDLRAIIRSYMSFKCSVTARQSDFLQVLTPTQQARWHSHAYSYAGRCCAKEVRLWAASWRGPLPELVFEKGDPGQHQLRKLLDGPGGYSPNQFRRKRDYFDRKTGTIEKGLPPLQAADLFAHEVLSWTREIARTRPTNQRDAARLHEDLEKIPGPIGIAKPSHLRFLRDGMIAEENHPTSLIMTTGVKIDLQGE